MWLWEASRCVCERDSYNLCGSICVCVSSYPRRVPEEWRPAALILFSSDNALSLSPSTQANHRHGDHKQRLKSALTQPVIDINKTNLYMEMASFQREIRVLRKMFFCFFYVFNVFCPSFLSETFFNFYLLIAMLVASTPLL